MIEFKHICKSFSGNKALDDVSFTAESGEILALLGQNGAGKSTLMKILSGAYEKDSGSILINGKEVNISDPVEGEHQGIGIVYQELSGIPHLTVSENIVIGKDPVKKGFLDRKEEREIAGRMLEKLGAGDIPLDMTLGKLTVSKQQICEIAKCMASEPGIVVFDEPTTALTSQEKEKLFVIMDKMRKDGLTIIFVTHFLEDAIRMSDKCVILKDGKVVYSGQMEGMDDRKIVNYMLARRLDSFFPKYENYQTDRVALEVKNLSDSVVNGCSFQVAYGEVLGISGLIGAGRTELAHLLIGERKKSGGEIYIDGRLCSIKNENDALKCGMVYVNEDRRTGGLNLTLGIDFNISIPSIVLGRKEIMNGPFVKNRSVRKMAEEMIEKLQIKCSSPEEKPVFLSGGNQQKVSIAKWVASGARILIFDEPTKGIDVSAKAKVYEVIRDLAKAGCAIIMISSYDPELQGVCDRISVMSKGRFVQTFERGVTEEELVLAQQK
ncbi:sugar ABC transporter ATP-binding protein [Marvinbryantia sp.]|uniref:sugar ABC transporter ATP-binding protein n=1 Tax=Marvinbryantia sp. TaxID=2496532 RepID=UPI0025D6C8D4|nr:sugar ABC transporter ATP-binding protein [uncultured Marvinbryantia sp.]